MDYYDSRYGTPILANGGKVLVATGPRTCSARSKRQFAKESSSTVAERIRLKRKKHLKHVVIHRNSTISSRTHLKAIPPLQYRIAISCTQLYFTLQRHTKETQVKHWCTETTVAQQYTLV